MLAPRPSNDLSIRAPRRMRLQPHHREMARLMVEGYSHSEVAKIVGLTPASVTRISQNPLFVAHLETLQGQADLQAVDVMDRIKGMVPKCLKVIQEYISGEGDGVDPSKRVDKALDVLKMSHSQLRGYHPGGAGGGGIHAKGDNVQINVGEPKEMSDKELDVSIESALRSLEDE